MDWGAVAWAPFQEHGSNVQRKTTISASTDGSETEDSSNNNSSSNSASNTRRAQRAGPLYMAKRDVLDTISCFVDDGGRQMLFTGYTHRQGISCEPGPRGSIAWSALRRCIEAALPAPATVIIWLVGSRTADIGAILSTMNEHSQANSRPPTRGTDASQGDHEPTTKCTFVFRFFGTAGQEARPNHTTHRPSLTTAATFGHPPQRPSAPCPPPPQFAAITSQVPVKKKQAQPKKRQSSKRKHQNAACQNVREPVYCPTPRRAQPAMTPIHELPHPPRSGNARGGRRSGRGPTPASLLSSSSSSMESLDSVQSAMVPQRLPSHRPQRPQTHPQPQSQQREGRRRRRAPGMLLSLKTSEAVAAIRAVVAHVGPFPSRRSVDIGAVLQEKGVTLNPLAAVTGDGAGAGGNRSQQAACDAVPTPYVCTRLTAREENTATLARRRDVELKFSSRACEVITSDKVAAFWWCATRQGPSPISLNAIYTLDRTPKAAQAHVVYEAIHRHLFALLWRADAASDFSPPTGPMPIAIARRAVVTLTLVP